MKWVIGYCSFCYRSKEGQFRGSAPFPDTGTNHFVCYDCWPKGGPLKAKETTPYFRRLNNKPKLFILSRDEA